MLLCAIATSAAAQEHAGDTAPDHQHMAGMEMPGELAMAGMLGPYPMTRESSGTSWQPDDSPMAGVHASVGSWATMLHGAANFIHDVQGGPRGATQTFSSSMLMYMGRHEIDHGALGFHLMISGDPFMGPRGYPELFQTGETADGVHPLIDRQHPHNLLMEAAGSYSADLAPGDAVFLYGGVAGEPALGPPAFMHRYSGMDNPAAPLGHHWLDATHVTYGVMTAGYERGRAKLEASAFNGREPDQDRYKIEMRKPDSTAVRLSFNPTDALAVQVSSGRLASPEQLEPGVAVRRTTASIIVERTILGAASQSTLAWGRNMPHPGSASNAWLLECAAVANDRHTLLARAERVAKDELFVPGQALFGRTFTIDSLTAGYIFDFARQGPVRVGIGATATAYRYASALNATYGAARASYLLFLRARL